MAVVDHAGSAGIEAEQNVSYNIREGGPFPSFPTVLFDDLSSSDDSAAWGSGSVFLLFEACIHRVEVHMEFRHGVLV